MREKMTWWKCRYVSYWLKVCEMSGWSYDEMVGMLPTFFAWADSWLEVDNNDLEPEDYVAEDIAAL